MTSACCVVVLAEVADKLPTCSEWLLLGGAAGVMAFLLCRFCGYFALVFLPLSLWVGFLVNVEMRETHAPLRTELGWTYIALAHAACSLPMLGTIAGLVANRHARPSARLAGHPHGE